MFPSLLRQFCLPVQGVMDFQDNDSLHQFVFDAKPYVPLCKALGFSYEDDPNGHKLLADAVERLGLSPGQQHYIHKLWAGRKDGYRLFHLVGLFTQT